MLPLVTPKLPNSGEIQIQILLLMPSSFLTKPVKIAFNKDTYAFASVRTKT